MNSDFATFLMNSGLVCPEFISCLGSSLVSLQFRRVPAGRVAKSPAQGFGLRLRVSGSVAQDERGVFDLGRASSKL